MKISLSDDLMDALAAQLRPGQDITALVEARLAQLLTIPLGHPFLVLSHSDLDAIGMAAGRTMPPLSAAQIIAYIERLGRVRLGDVKIEFSVGHLEEIARLAAREGQDPAQYIGRVAATILSQFFRSPAMAGEIPSVRTVEYLEGAPDAPVTA
jgi:hypothetical protein